MATSPRLYAAAAFLAVVAACGTDTVVPPPSAGPSPIPPSTGTRTSAAGSLARERLIASGIYPPFLVDAPGDWEEWRGAAWFMLKQPETSLPSSIEINFHGYRRATDESLQCEPSADAAEPVSVDALIALVKANPGIDVTAEGLTAGAHPGRFLDLALSPRWTKTCAGSAGRPAVLVPSVLYLEGEDRVRLVLVDLPGTILLIRILDRNPDKFDHAVTVAMPIVESLQP